MVARQEAALQVSILDAMIVRAEGACDRYRRELHATALTPLVKANRLRSLVTMEERLRSLRQRRKGSPASQT